MISSQNAVVISNDDPLTRAWIGDDRIQSGQMLRPMPHAPRCPSVTISDCYLPPTGGRPRPLPTGTLFCGLGPTSGSLVME